eukprot:TRINITY_DN42838_c0_g1_i1.p1 TRINITY_DN42838_c0_g1~~TRINITY_DN42838_c0_g1_i1.p1  ORF type:complete len:182 (-),score=40.81 TRINITY_DN42838_c0_g1_i1:117-662(-)
MGCGSMLDKHPSFIIGMFIVETFLAVMAVLTIQNRALQMMLLPLAMLSLSRAVFVGFYLQCSGRPWSRSETLHGGLLMLCACVLVVYTLALSTVHHGGMFRLTGLTEGSTFSRLVLLICGNSFLCSLSGLGLLADRRAPSAEEVPGAASARRRSRGGLARPEETKKQPRVSGKEDGVAARV